MLDGLLALSGDGPALRGDGWRVTRTELLRRTIRIEAALTEGGLGPGQAAALLVERDATGVATILAVLRCGACVVPLDPRAPTARLGRLLDRAAPSVLLVAGHGLRRLPGLRRAGVRLPTCLVIEADGTATISPEAHWPSKGPSLWHPSDGYAMFTSGSTGEPKGIVVSREALSHLLGWFAATFPLEPGERTLALAPLHFDISLVELLFPIGCGACVCPAPPLCGASPEALAAFLVGQSIRFAYVVASVARGLSADLDAASALPLTRLILSGEPLSASWLDPLMTRVPGLRVFNLYGSTEIPVCTISEVSRPPLDPIPLGEEAAGTCVRLVRADGNEALPGEEGELWASGPLVMTRHLGQPDLDAQRLRILPTGERWLCTGDLARRGEDRALRFVGRRDQMVKLRGCRVDLGEVEAALQGCPGVAQAVALAPEIEAGERRLVLVVLPRSPDLSASAVEAALARVLPGAMMPERLVLVPELPRLSTGKVDRQALIREFSLQFVGPGRITELPAVPEEEPCRGKNKAT